MARTRVHRRNDKPDPDVAQLLRLVETGAVEELERFSRSVLARRPNHPLALKALSAALLGQERFDDAVALLVPSIQLYGKDPELHNNLGIAYSMLLRWEKACECFNESLRLDERNAETWKNLGAAFCKMHRFQEAMPPLIKAIELHAGEYVEAVSLLGSVLDYTGHADAAVTCFAELSEHEPQNPAFLTQLISASMKVCDWGGLDQRLARWRELTDGNDAEIGGPPFTLFSLPGLNLADHRKFAEIHARASIPPQWLGAAPRLVPGRAGKKLRVAYLSADFRHHPVAYVIPEVIERHDRSRFEVVGYSLKGDDGSDIRKRLVGAFDAFVDIEGDPIQVAAEKIRGDDIDILVDLQGWTAFGHPEILALRPAPMIATWLGYAGTLGHRRLADYLIGDPVATPATHAGFFAEHLAQMPSSYLPADTTRPLAAPPAHEAAGLPAGKFVFCSFNGCYKFNPSLFDLWCAILKRCPDSVLWLSKPNSTAQANLRGEIASRGIDPDRLVFAPRVEAYADHLARVSLADLALDTSPYNSHSTGIDTLWAGVPMLSLIGDSFPGRVGASLLRAAGLDELATASPANYVEVASALYSEPERLSAIRLRLADARRESALFDMRHFVLSLEGLYRRMWENHCSGTHQAILEPSPDSRLQH